MKKYLLHEIAEKLTTLVEKFTKNAKRSSKYGTDTTLFRSEIHVIHIIGNKPGMHVVEIADKFNVTKGAISQVLKKLEKKGMVYKETDQQDKKGVLLYLTKKGQAAYNSHKENHLKKDAELFDFLFQLNESELSIISRFLEKVEKMTNEHI